MAGASARMLLAGMKTLLTFEAAGVVKEVTVVLGRG